jgi:CheY-like chemotaxis protein
MTPRILVADDSITIQKVVELTFSKEDFQIIRALNGVEALAKAKESKPDIILLDIFMPEKNGYEVCESLRKDPQLKEVPIIFLVAAFEEFDKERSLRSGANDYVTKPFESKQLIAKVKQHLFARSAKMTSEKEGVKGEVPGVKVGPPPWEAPAAPTPVEVTPPTPPVRPTPFVTELVTEQGPVRIEEDKPSWGLEAEMLATSVSGPEAQATPPGGGKRDATLPSVGEEAEAGVSDEELWQMLDLGSTEAPPLLPPAPQEARVEEPESAVVPEDSAEAFFDLYSKDKDTTLEAPSPETSSGSTPEIPFESLGEPKSEEQLILQGKDEEEIISFDNLQAAVAGEDVTLSREEGLIVETVGAEKKLEPEKEPPKEVGEAEKELLPSLPIETEEVQSMTERVEAVEASRPSAPPADQVLSEKVTGELADRIVKEVSDRLVSRIEKIIWEVVPDLAEVLITKEIEKIKAAVEEPETS